MPELSLSALREFLTQPGPRMATMEDRTPGERPVQYGPLDALAQGIGGGIANTVMTPGAQMARNPYDRDRDTEAWQWFENKRAQTAENWGPEMALNMVTSGGTPQGALGSGARDPRLWSPISGTKLRKPLDEMAHQYTDVRTPVPKFVDPASLQGGYGIFTPGDLSAANRTLTHVDNIPLERPVTAHGGVGFPEANPGQAWASEAPIASKLDNQAARLSEETGKPVYIMPMTMSPSGIDASHHVADPLSQLVKGAKINRDDVTAFNNMMRERVPDWVSIKSDKFQDYINNMQGGMKTKALMAHRMGLAEWQAKGFPDVAAVRHAMSEPGLIDVPRNTTGMAISRYIPGQGLLETTHPSYSKGVAGEHMGQLAELLPFDVAASTIAKGLAEVNARNFAAGKKVAIQPRYHMEKPTTGVPTAQYFDQEWLDNVMKRLDR